MNRKLPRKQDTWNKDRPVSRVFRNIMLISRTYNDAMDELAKENGLQTGDFMVLMTLLRAGGEGGLTPTELYNELLVASGTITKRVDRLEKAGLILRKSSVNDRRSSLIKLTQEGAAKAEGIRQQSNQLHAIAEIFGAERLGQLDAVLQDYLGAIDSYLASGQAKRKSANRAGSTMP